MAILEEIRKEITSLDEALLHLLSRRKELSIEVARSKQATHRPIRDEHREQELLERLIAQGRPLGLSAHYIHQIYRLIIEDSVLSQQSFIQEQLNGQGGEAASIAFLGPVGSYSSLAARKYLARHVGTIHECSCASFQDVIQSVESGQVALGVLPIENTSSGSINEVYDLMQHTTLSIVGELTLPIDHCLLAATETTEQQITTIYAHPQPIQQCSHYLQSRMSKARLEYCDSSSAAMAKVRELNSATAAALGSDAGGALFGLHPIAEHLANQTDNITRFIVVARKPIDVALQIPAKTTLILSTAQKAGSLVEALLILRNHDINMTKLESRPIQGNPWEEMFYIDVAANLNDPAMQTALRELNAIARSLKVLGCYPSEDVRPTQLPAYLTAPQI